MLHRILPAVVLLCVGLALPVQAQSAPKIAVANTSQIINHLEEFKEMNQKMQDESTHLRDKQNAMRSEVQALQQQRDLYTPGSDEYRKADEAFTRKAIEFEVWQKTTQHDIEHTNKVQSKALFEKVRDAVQKIASERGIDLVVAVQNDLPANVDKLSPPDLRNLILQQSVLYASDKLDLTQDVIALLNKNYISTTRPATK